jgi:hypothetical protein
LDVVVLRDDEVGVELRSPSGPVVATADSACLRCGGSSRPLLSARRKIPAAALRLKKYLGATLSSSTSAKDENSAPSLGHSEVSAVQDSPGEVVKPELGQRRENDGKIPSALGGKESGYVLNEDIPSGLYKLICDPRELKEETAAGSIESGSFAGDAEVLTGEPSAEEINATP